MTLLYADEDFDYGAVEELRRLGHDVVTVQEAGKAGGGDPLVLSFATSQGRAVLTHNRRHFRRLHKTAASHAGIIVCTRDADPVALANRIHGAIQSAVPLDNKLIRVNRPPATRPPPQP